MSSVEKLARELHETRAEIKSLTEGPQLAFSSIEDGAMDEYDADGNLVGSYGKQYDGTHVSASLGGPKPPQPQYPDCEGGPGILTVRWSGKFIAGNVSPMDFKHVSVHVMQSEEEEANSGNQFATIRGELGDSTVLQLIPGAYFIRLVAWSMAGRWSEASNSATAEVTVPADTDAINAALTGLDDKYGGVITEAAELGGRLDQAEVDLTAHDGRLTAADGRLDTAFGELAAVDGKIDTATDAALAAAKLDAKAKADAAKTAAVDAATIIAAAKADAAEAAAKTAAATDAQTKADAAKSAAISAAKAASDLAASGAQQAAIDAAKTDATQKADAARQAAEQAAAADATAKANKAKADATTAAANDATAKANDAKAEAVAAAATDATAKAGQAKADAVAEATTMTDGIGKNLSSTKAPTSADKAPNGSVWRRTDSSGRIIGSWEQTGAGVAGTWTPRLIASDVVDNLDVGKLSASSASINDLVAQKVAASTAAFQTADIGNLFAGSATISEAVIDKLWADVLHARKITTEMLAIGSFDNLISEPRFDNGGKAWQVGATAHIVDGEARNGGPVLRLEGGADAVSSFNLPAELDTAGGTAWRLSAWVRPSVDVPRESVWLFARTRNASGAYSYPRVINEDTLTAGVWAQVSGIVEAPGDADTVTFAISTRPGYPAEGSLDVDRVSAARAAGGELIVDGALDARTITAPKIQTHTESNRGLKWLKDSLVAYNGAGTQTFSLSATTGKATFQGDVVSGSTISGSRIYGTSVEGGKITMNGSGAGDGFSLSLKSDSYGGVMTLDTPLSTTPGTLRSVTSDDGYNDGASEIVLRSPATSAFPYRGFFKLKSWRGDGGVLGRSRITTNSDLTFDRSAGISAQGSLRVGAVNNLTLVGGAVKSTSIRDREYTFSANAICTSNGYMGRTTSSRRNKLCIEDMPDYDDQILSLRARTWFDRTSSEGVAELLALQDHGQPTVDGEGDPLVEAPDKIRRVPGMVAEEVEAAGLTEFVEYGEDGQVDGLMYDRLGVALIPVVARQRDRIDSLESRIAAIEAA